MGEDFEKRFISKDGKTRITIYKEECPDSPRYMTDEPFHCEDWSRGYTIMTSDERDDRSSDKRSALCWIISVYGDRKKIVDLLVKNNVTNVNSRLVYDRSERGWFMQSNFGHGWNVVDGWYCKRKELTDYIYELMDAVSNDALYYIINNYLTDKIKIAGYEFGHYGEISFTDLVSEDSDGIAWLDKDELLKYSGGSDKEHWHGKTLREIEWLVDALERYGDGDVYGFKYEQAVKVITSKHYPNGEHEDSEEETTEWEEKDSCWGFYEELDNMLENALYSVGGSVDDYTEE